MSKSWLALALLLTSLAQARPLTSCDGHYQVIEKPDEFQLFHDGHRMWRCPRTSPFLTPLALSPTGKVALHNNYQIVVLDPDRHQEILTDQCEVTTAWFSQKGDRLFTVGPTICWLRRGSDSPGCPASQSDLLPELDNPDSYKDRLVLALGPGLPRGRSFVGLHPWVEWAIQARQGSPKPLQQLAQAHPRGREEWELWLRAHQFISDAHLERALHRAWSEFSPSDSDPPWGYLGASIVPWAQRALVDCRSGHLADNLFLILRNRFEPLPRGCYPTLERLARSPQHQSDAVSLVLGSQEPEGRRSMLRLLTPALAADNAKRILQDLCEEPDPESVPVLAAGLAESAWPRPIHDLFRKALIFQCRVDLGENPQAWLHWQQTPPPQRIQLRLEQQGPNSKATLLLKGSLGRLRRPDADGQMRLLRILPERAIIDPSGRWLVGQEDGSLTTLSADLPVRSLSPGQWLTDPDRAGGITWERGTLTPVQLAPYQHGAAQKFENSALWGKPLRIENSLVWFSGGLADAHSGLPLWRAPAGEILQASRTSARAIVETYDGCQLWDIQNNRMLLQRDSLRASQDFELVLEDPGRHGNLRAIHENGHPRGPLLRGDGGGELLPDGSRMLVLRRGQMQLVDPLTDKASAERPEIRDWSRACFSQDQQTLVLTFDHEVECRNTRDLNLVSRTEGTHPWEPHLSADGRLLSLNDLSDTKLWETRPKLHQLPPAEHQDLFAELWTGCRLRAGQAIPLTHREYQKRRLQWRTLTGQDWSLSPDYPTPLPSPWLATRPLLLLLPLAPLAWWLRRRK